MKKFILPIALVGTLLLSGCNATKNAINNINFFSPAQDMELGQQVSAEIEGDPVQFPILAEKGNEEAYRYIRGIKDRILETDTVRFKDEFAWQVKIIDQDSVLNAFCTPGGYIYVYTGLINFLDSEDQLAGVMGHEMAHAALRHSTRQITKMYGLQALLMIVTGKAEPSMIEQIALALTSLRFSRTHESEADDHSVVYLCKTDYNAAGAAAFFKKMEGQPTPPEFLSTHPNPANRVVDIEAKAETLGCGGTATYSAEYERIKKLLANRVRPPAPKKELPGTGDAKTGDKKIPQKDQTPEVDPPKEEEKKDGGKFKPIEKPD